VSGFLYGSDQSGSSRHRLIGPAASPEDERTNVAD
jgi:hypothetical protein